MEIILLGSGILLRSTSCVPAVVRMRHSGPFFRFFSLRRLTMRLKKLKSGHSRYGYFHCADSLLSDDIGRQRAEFLDRGVYPVSWF
jgi:hypothetical protein